MAKKDKTTETPDAAAEAPKGPSLEARLAKVEKELSKISYIVRKQFTRGATLPLLALCLLIPALSYGADAVQQWNGTTATDIWKYDKDGDVTVTGGKTINTPVALTSTAEMAITVTAAHINLDASAQSLPVITNTIVAPVVAGEWTVIVNSGVSNSVVITEGTTLDSGGSKTLGPEDVLFLFGRSTSAWSAIFHDN